MGNSIKYNQYNNTCELYCSQEVLAGSNMFFPTEAMPINVAPKQVKEDNDDTATGRGLKLPLVISTSINA